jgi:Histidine kinase-, DNA gyrase B-, and HSP90-like ATPase
MSADHSMLVLEDPGGEPLDRFIGARWKSGDSCDAPSPYPQRLAVCTSARSQRYQAEQHPAATGDPQFDDQRGGSHERRRGGARELLISAAKTESDVLIAMRDSGPGFAPENVDRIFESFYTTKRGGLGIGLSICSSIIEAHGGRLWASANEPRGATFQFSLPEHPEGLSPDKIGTSDSDSEHSPCAAKFSPSLL